MAPLTRPAPANPANDLSATDLTVVMDEYADAIEAGGQNVLLWWPATQQWFHMGVAIPSGTRPTSIPARPNGPGAILVTDMDATFTEPPNRQTGAKEMAMEIGDVWQHAGGITLTNLDADV